MEKEPNVQKAAVVSKPAASGAPAAPAQNVETEAYVPRYKVKPELKDAILKAIGEAPFNQIAGIMQAINVPEMDHNTLTQVINVLGNFPYIKVADLLRQVNNYVEQVIEDDD